MKMVKNIAIVALATTFMFAGVGFHTANNYMDMDGTTTVTQSWGVTYELNDNTSIGWDSALGMMMYFDALAGVTLRLGWTAENDPTPATTDNDDATSASTSIGLGYTWWTGGTGLKTSISTNYDYMMAPNADDAVGDADMWIDGDKNTSNLSVTVGFGF